MITSKIKELEREIEELRGSTIFDNVKDYQTLKELNIKLQLLKELSLEIEKEIDELASLRLYRSKSCQLMMRRLKQKLLGGKE
jgi:predicted  nucleic acid-binding Zn-ribbon protein